ncbi:MAG TPA: lasso peptide biosynthesis protein [Thermoanaerobaculia bacterium]|nr:lasso peptide biosynthesis protein [Thermoanaerobaculia bacterium]
MSRGRAKVGFALLAMPAVVRAALRCAWLERQLTLEDLVARLRETPPFAVRALRRPEWLLATLDRVLPLLPPWHYGACLKRSLLLLDLWSRCELKPALHLGVRRDGASDRHRAHAWVTVAAWPAGTVAPATSSEGYPEAFSL